jgi:hypothetical protein
MGVLVSMRGMPKRCSRWVDAARSRSLDVHADMSLAGTSTNTELSCTHSLPRYKLRALARF